jgi:hypothetical protein
MLSLAIGMILQIHKGHGAYFMICYLNCPHGLQAPTGYNNISYTVSSVDAQKLNPENLIDCPYTF